MSFLPISKPQVSPSDFVSPNHFLDSLICSICKSVLFDPVMDACCHNFCANCLANHLQTSPFCPVTHRPLKNTDSKPNNLLTNMLIDQLVNCCHRTTGCSYQGMFSSIYDHYAECPYQPICCPNEGCLQTFERRELAEHLGTCAHQNTACTACSVQIKSGNLSLHLLVCSEVKIKCPLDCGIFPRRSEVTMHVSECKQNIYECPFSKVGCGFSATKVTQLSEHFKESGEKHNQMMIINFHQVCSFDSQIENIVSENNRNQLLSRKRHSNSSQMSTDHCDAQISYKLFCGNKVLNCESYKWATKVSTKSWTAYGICNKELLKYREELTEGIVRQYSYFIDTSGSVWNGKHKEKGAALYVGQKVKLTYSKERERTLVISRNGVKTVIKNIEEGEFFPCMLVADGQTIVKDERQS